MGKKVVFRASLFALAALLLVLGLGRSPQAVTAQGDPQALRVEAAATGQLSASSPEMFYTFQVYESTRMAVVLNVTEGDMQLNVTVFDQDGETVLAQGSGPAVNGLVVSFPAQGQYFLRVGSEPGGTSASYRVFIDADPSLPTDAFVLQSYLVSGDSAVCSENQVVSMLTPTESLGVCFVVGLVTAPTDISVQWWSPSGAMVFEDPGQIDASFDQRQPILSGLTTQDGSSWEEGWWQAHIMINGELAHIQWVPVSAQ